MAALFFKDVCLPYWSPKEDKFRSMAIQNCDVLLVTFPEEDEQQLMPMILNLILGGGTTPIKPEVEIQVTDSAIWRIYTPVVASDAVHPKHRVICCNVKAKDLPTQVWEQKIPVIYITRPFDEAVYYLFHVFKSSRTKGTRPLFRSFTEFFNFFTSNRAATVSWFRHVQEYWNIRDKENVLFLTNEDIKKNLLGVIQRVSKFLLKETAEDVVQQVISHPYLQDRLHIAGIGESSSEAIRLSNVHESWKDHMTVQQADGLWKIFRLHMRNYPELAKRLMSTKP